jgi:hypothetical protein
MDKEEKDFYSFIDKFKRNFEFYLYRKYGNTFCIKAGIIKNGE